MTPFVGLGRKADMPAVVNFAAGDNCLMAAVGRGDGAEAGQAIREHMRARLQMPLGPGCDGLSAEATHSCDPGVNRMTRLVQGDGRDNGDLVL